MLGEGLMQIPAVREGYQKGEDRAFDLLKKELISEKQMQDSLKRNMLLNSEIESDEAMNFQKINKISENQVDYVKGMSDEDVRAMISEFQGDQLNLYNSMGPNDQYDYINDLIGAGRQFGKERQVMDQSAMKIKHLGGEAPVSREPQGGPAKETWGPNISAHETEEDTLDLTVGPRYGPQTADGEDPGLNLNMAPDDVEQSLPDKLRDLFSPVGEGAKEAYGAATRGASSVMDSIQDPQGPRKIGFSDLAGGNTFKQYSAMYPGRAGDKQVELLKSKYRLDAAHAEGMLKIKAAGAEKELQRKHEARQKKADRANAWKIAQKKAASKRAGGKDTSIAEDQRNLDKYLDDVKGGIGINGKLKAARIGLGTFQNESWNRRYKNSVDNYFIGEGFDPPDWDKLEGKNRPKPKQRKAAPPKSSSSSSSSSQTTMAKASAPSTGKTPPAVVGIGTRKMYYNPMTKKYQKRPYSHGRQVE